MTYAPASLEAKYGRAAFGAALDLAEEETLLCGVMTFRDRSHHDAVMAEVDRDERIAQVCAEVAKLLDLSRIVRGSSSAWCRRRKHPT